jgi:uncharacterized protein YndB with AHSA1/START domain
MLPHDERFPGSAPAVHVLKEGDLWTLVLVKHLRHAPHTVWKALVDPQQLKEWAPFDADKPLDRAGSLVTLTTPGAAVTQVASTTVRRAEAPKVLEYDWGGRGVRWELEDHAEGTKLSLWATIDKRYIAMGAAGWHLCFDVLDAWLRGEPVGRLVGADALRSERWQKLNQDYTRQFAADESHKNEETL